MPGRLRGISEYVSAALLALIVLGLGSIVVARILSNVQTAKELTTKEVVNAQLSSSQDLGISLAYIDANGVLHVVAVSAETPVKLLGVYINGTLWSSSCNVTLNNGTTYVGAANVTIPYYTAAQITCSLPAGSTLASVKIVYMGGSCFAVAKRI